MVVAFPVWYRSIVVVTAVVDVDVAVINGVTGAVYIRFLVVVAYR